MSEGVDHLERLKQHAARLKEQNEKLKESNEKLRERAERAEARQGKLPSGDVPKFFVVGRGRSGTTWLMRVLDAHPEVVCKGEGRIFDAHFENEALWDLHPGVQGTSLYNALKDSRRLNEWVSRAVWTKRDRATTEDHLNNLMALSVNYFLERKLAAEGPRKRIVGDKTPFADSMTFLNGNRSGGAPSHNGAVMLDEIANVLPGAKVVHVIRDGRDVAVSTMHFLWSRSRDEGWIYELSPEERRKRAAYHEGSLSEKSIFAEERLAALARGWAQEAGRAVEQGPKVLGDDYLEVRYEAMAADPEKEVGRILAFLGADTSETRAALEGANAETARAVERDGSGVQFRKGVAGGWREVFTEEDRRIFAEHAGETLARLGYEADR